jgi:hypothetical protein
MKCRILFNIPILSFSEQTMAARLPSDFVTRQRCEAAVGLRNPAFHAAAADFVLLSGGLRCCTTAFDAAAADFVPRHSMPLLLCSADFVSRQRCCRCSGLRLTAAMLPLQRTSSHGSDAAAAADFVSRQRCCRCSGLRCCTTA